VVYDTITILALWTNKSDTVLISNTGVINTKPLKFFKSYSTIKMACGRRRIPKALPRALINLEYSDPMAQKCP